MLSRKYDASQVFNDFLTIVICCMCREQQETLYFETIKRYEKDELNQFAQLFGEIALIYHNAEILGKWCDPLGQFYEALASNYKKSSFGQFFTPKAICDLMSGFILEPNTFGKKVNEPACGSGRAVLSANNYAPGNYYICQDLDPICCKMAAINLCFHEVRGEVHCMDTLRMSDPTQSYYINYEFWKHKTKLIIMK
ncbi:N-6 DNA methylase [Formosa undariae]|uniref:site-specific DNA-methyltransferase (adenine-specific) n=2 Tax=Formosa undariae TaxID=1325436 RepID=A0ABV5F6N7_9FLAO